MAKQRTCRCGCKEVFTPSYRSQRYLSKRHKNRAAQARLRKRVKNGEK